MPRLAAAARIKDAATDEALRLALDYQLLSPFTHYLVIAERAEKAADLPQLQTTPQMLAVGWGGTGAMEIDPFAPSASSFSSPCFHYEDIDELLAPSTEGKPEPDVIADSTPSEFIFCLQALLPHISPPFELTMFKSCGLDRDLLAELERLVAAGHEEARVVVAFLYALTQSALGALLERSTRRIMVKAWKTQPPGAELDHAMAALLPRDWADARWSHSQPDAS